MKETTRTEYTWKLDEAERFDWVKRNGVHAGHGFTVHEVTLEVRGDQDESVYLRGPWTDGFSPGGHSSPAGNHVRGGWEFLYAYSTDDLELIRELPPFVLEAMEAKRGARCSS